MELGDYLRIIGRRWWLIAVVTVLAAILMAALYPPDDRYVSVATVQIDTENMSSNDRLDFIANFGASIDQASVRDAISEALLEQGYEVSSTAVNQRLSVERAGGGATFIRLRDDATSGDEAVAGALLRTAATEAVGFVNLPRVQVLEAERDRINGLREDAVAELDVARAAVDSAIEAAGGVDPATTYASLQSEIQTLQLAFVIAPDAATRAQIQTRLDEANNDLPEAARAAAEFEELIAAERAADNARIQALDDLERANADLAEVQNPPSVTFQRLAEKTAGSPSLVQRLLAAAVVGLLLSSGLVLLIDLQRLARQPKLRRKDDPVFAADDHLDGDVDPQPKALDAVSDVERATEPTTF